MKGSSDFSSFVIADQAMESISSVDVVSDAENIKKVLFLHHPPPLDISVD